jgi:tyrosyl-tRNA synthetase
MTQTNENRMETARAILDRGVVSGVLPDRESFLKRLASTTPMRIYIGADPTSTALHLSHAKNYMLLEEFRKLGHEVIVLFGDFTARIGDPTDRMSARKQLTSDEVKANVAQWLEQIRPLMDFEAAENPPQVKFNADWLAKLTMEDVLNLMSMVTVQRMLERDMFEKRMKLQQPIHLHEFMYPLMQGFDSVAMEVDAELCGTDQTFNALMGRTLLERLKGKDKFVVTVNLMENPKTGELMSKSRGTGVFLDTDAFGKFGSIMAQPDEMIEIILVNNTRLPLSEIATILKVPNPRDAKMRAAFEVTRIFHGEDAAKEANERFVRLVQAGESDENVPEVSLDESERTVFSLMREVLTAEEFSNQEIRRLIEQGSIKINGEKCTDRDAAVSIPAEGLDLKVGKKRWFKVRARKLA